MGVVRIAAVVIATVAVTSGAWSLRAWAQGQPKPFDGPVFFHAYERGSQRSMLSAYCEQDLTVTSGRPKINCRFDTASMWRETRPDSAEKAAQGWEFVLKKPGGLDEFCKHNVGKPWAHEPDGQEAALQNGIKEGCAAKSIDKIVDAYRVFLNDTEVKSCELNMHHWFESFEQQDANTWVGKSGPRGACDDTYVSTIWRDNPKERFWNYKQMQITPENPPTTMFCNRKGGNIETHMFSWRREHFDIAKELTCKYMAL